MPPLPSPLPTPVYTYISPSFSRWVEVSRYIYLDIAFSESLGWSFSLYILTYLLQWVAGLKFLVIYTYISPSVSRWVEVSRYIYLHISFSESLGWSFSLYILTYLLQWVAGLKFLVIYTYISPSVSRWVEVSRYIYLHISFSDSLGRYIYLHISN